MPKTSQRIAPCLWFDHQAEEAAQFYVGIFPKSKVGSIARYDANTARAAGRPEGSVMTVTFELDGQEFMALNGGPVFHFTEAISFMVSCATQAEVDHFWDRLSAGGQQVECGWLKDRYGVSWQVVPTILVTLLQDQDRDAEKAKRVMAAMLQMKKFDIAALERAARG
jgi:predicted 3-demethylubiquinone-9 3-methyltransferase (glyoxalase superfamily)